MSENMQDGRDTRPADHLWNAATEVEDARDAILYEELDFGAELPDDTEDLSATCAKVASVLRDLAVNTEARQDRGDGGA